MSRRVRGENPYFPREGLNSDSQGLTIGEAECADVENLKILPTGATLRSGSRKLGTDSPGTVYHFERFAPPDADEILFAFTGTDIQKYNEGAGTWDSVLAGGATVPSGVTFWSVTPILQSGVGYTLVAAGSAPPALGEEEGDSATRVLYIYDPGTGTFDDLAMTQWTRVIGEATGLTVPATATPETGYLTAVPDGLFVQGGTCTFYTADGQALGTASKLEDTEGGETVYRIVPFDPDVLTEGWVEKEGAGGNGAAFSLTFVSGLAAKYQGQAIYVDYTHQETVTYAPRFVWWFHNRLCMANTVEDGAYLPWRFRWTWVQDPTVADQLDYFDTINQSIEPITGGAHQGPFLTLVKPNSLIRVYHVEAEVPETYRDVLVAFNFQTQYIGGGTYAGRTVVSYQNILFFLGADDVYAFDGEQIISITHNHQQRYSKIRRDLLGRLDTLNYWKSFAALDAVEQEIRFFILDTDEAFPTLCYVYNIRYGTWTKYRYAPVSAAGTYRQEPFTAYDDLLGTFDEQEWLYSHTTVSGALYSLVFGHTDKVVLEDKNLNTDGGYEDTGEWVGASPVSWYMVTRDFIYRNLRTLDRTTRVKLEAAGDSLAVGVSGEYQIEREAFSQWQNVPVSGTMRTVEYYPDIAGRHVRLYLEGTGSIALRWIQPFGIELEFDGGMDSGN